MRKDHDGGEKRGVKKEKADENSGDYVIASSRPPKRRPLECRTLVPKVTRLALFCKFGLFANFKTCSTLTSGIFCLVLVLFVLVKG